MSSRRDPFDELERTLDRLTRQFDTDLGGFTIGRGPAVDLAEGDDAYTVAVDLPGYDREDITVTASDDTLTIRADRTEDTEIDEENYIRRERAHHEVQRDVRLPGPVEEDQASATYRNGVLIVELPKRGDLGGGETIEVE